jgi:hypothetical protein
MTTRQASARSSSVASGCASHHSDIFSADLFAERPSQPIVAYCVFAIQKITYFFVTESTEILQLVMFLINQRVLPAHLFRAR